MYRRIIETLSILLILVNRLNTTDAVENSTFGHSNDDSMLKEILHKIELMDMTNVRIERELTEMKNYLVESLNKDIRPPRSENITLTDALRKHHSVTMDIWQSQKDILLQEFKHIMDQIIDRSKGEKCMPSEDAEISDYRLKLPRNCAEALKYGGKSGIYKIYLRESDLPPFNVYCLEDPNGDAPWLVIQRRKDGSVDFYRDWKDYKNGFGDQSGEFFLGLEKIHALTSAQPQELWIEMNDFSDESRFAKYDSFRIGDENSKYMLEQLGQYNGSAGNSLRSNDGQKFTTKDSDNDLAEAHNCAELYMGGWWYMDNIYNNLNGLYLGPLNWIAPKGQGITWYPWHSGYYSLKDVHMAIRDRK